MRLVSAFSGLESRFRTPHFLRFQPSEVKIDRISLDMGQGRNGPRVEEASSGMGQGGMSYELNASE
jgi:hypothetical protein